MSRSDAADEAFRVVLKRLAVEKVRCVDVETSGLSWQKNAIVGYVLAFSGDPRDSYYIPVRHAGDANLRGRLGLTMAEGWDGTVYPEERELVRLLDQQGTVLFGQNLAFDNKFLWRVGLAKLDARYEDTIINAALLDEYSPKFSLEYLCEQAGVAAKKSAQIQSYLIERFPELAKAPKAAMGSFWRLAGDDPMAIEYATGDGTSTWQLRDWQNQEIANQFLEKVHDIESRLIPVLTRMTMTGIKIDEERLDFLLVDIEKRVRGLLDKLPADFNVRSPTDVHKWCVDNGQTNWPLTPKGKPSFPQAWLETHEPGQQIVGVRKFTTLRDTFLRPMKIEHLYHGRVHTTFNQLRGDEYGTVTGRLSSSDPNLQAVSKHDRVMGRLHRSIFIPDEGKIWGNADYSQIEPRLLAHYSGARVLVDGYNANPPVDAHTAVSAAMNRRWPDMSKDERKHYRDAIGKRINQSLITGGGLNSLTKKWGIPADEAKNAWNNYFRAMPEIKVIQKRAANKFRTAGFVMTLLGRRCRYNGERDYVALNRLLQSGNADIVKVKMVQVDDYLASIGRPMDMINSIHDDLAFQFGEAHRAVYNECLRVMVDFSPGQPIEIDTVPMAVDAGEGRSWAEATFGAEE